MFGIEVTTVFRAAHQLRLPPAMGGGVEPLHEHDWRSNGRVHRSGSLTRLETVMDFHTVEQALRKICTPWQNQSLNEIEPFVSARNPSAERVAERIGEAADGGSAESGDASGQAAAPGGGAGDGIPGMPWDLQNKLIYKQNIVIWSCGILPRQGSKCAFQKTRLLFAGWQALRSPRPVMRVSSDK